MQVCNRRREMVLQAIAEFITDVLLEYVYCRLFYWPGWLILRVLTLGGYPPVQSKPHNRYLVAGVPFIVLLIAVTLYYSCHTTGIKNSHTLKCVAIFTRSLCHSFHSQWHIPFNHHCEVFYDYSMAARVVQCCHGTGAQSQQPARRQR